MKKSILLLALLAVGGTAAARDNYVRGHTRSDGTYVQGHHRSAPDSNPYNNYSTQGNSNPYTGQQGNVAPQPSYQQPRTGYQQIEIQRPQPYRNIFGND